MRASTVIVGLAVACATSAIVGFLVVGTWVVKVLATHGFHELMSADATEAVIGIGSIAAIATTMFALPLSFLVFLFHKPLLKLLHGSFARYEAAGVALGLCSIAIMWSVGVPPHPGPSFDFAALIACISGPASSAMFWITTRGRA